MTTSHTRAPRRAQTRPSARTPCRLLGRRPALLALLGLIAACTAVERVAAATFTWTGASPEFIGVADNWGNFLNWQNTTVPVNDGTADVIIPDTPRDNSNVNVPWSIRSLEFQGPADLSVNGDPLTLNDITHNGTGTATFNNPVGVAGNGAIWRAASGPMTFHGAISGSNSINLQAVHPIRFEGSAVNTLTGALTVTQGTLILARSSPSGSVGAFLQLFGGTARWEANDQIADALSSQLAVQNGGVADLNGKNETLGQLTVLDGGRVQSTGGQLVLAGQLGLQGDAEIALGAGQLVLRGSVVRSGASATTSNIAANLVTLDRVQSIFSVQDSSAAVELEVTANIAGAFPTTFLEKSGTGALRLTGANTWQAGTTISQGTLIIDNTTGSGTGPGSVLLASGGHLRGDGAISGPVLMSDGASISPTAATGFPIGSLTIGSLSMNNFSQFAVEFNQALPPNSRCDLLTVTGSAILNGQLNLTNLNSAVSPGSTVTHTILTSSSLSGTFANVASGARLTTRDGSGSWVVNYGPGSSFNANDVVLSNFRLSGDFDADGDVDGRDLLLWQRGGSPNPLSAADLTAWKSSFGQTSTPTGAAIPEPASAALAALGLMGARRRHRRAAAPPFGGGMPIGLRPAV